MALRMRKLLAISLGGGGVGILMYKLYGYVPLCRVWFSSSLVWRVKKSESVGLE